MKPLRSLVCILLISLYLPLFGQLTPQDAVPLMQKGINLGNTLEPPLEGGWNNPAAQEYYFDLYKQAGFQTVRIPVRWDQHTLATTPYTVSESWMQRVEQIVDWALERGLFVVINSHHDDWIKQHYADPLMRARFDSIWSQVSVRFRNKPEKLLFEVLNEPYGLTRSQNDEMHARILGIIRKTNPTRIVIIQGHNWGGSDELITAAIPDDDYIMGSFHSYDPYLFGLEGQGTWGTTGDYNTLENKFVSVKNWSVTHQVPVFLGEFGSLRSCDYNSRMKHYRAYVELAQKYGFVACAWDDGGDFRIMERSVRKWDEVKDILIHTSLQSPYLSLKIARDTLVEVHWSNTTDADSVFVEYRTPTGTFNRIAVAAADTLYWYHEATADAWHYYRIISKYGAELRYSQPQRIYMPEFVPKTRGFYLGAPLAIPGTVEAEDFDTGGEGLTWHDASVANIGGAYRNSEGVDIFARTGGGYYISSVWPGEWIEYTVSVGQTGKYSLDFHVASKEGAGTFVLNMDTVSTDTLSAPATLSSVNTAIISDTLELNAGQFIMRFTILDIPYFSLDKIVFSLVPEITGVKNHVNEDISVIWGSDGNLVVGSGSEARLNHIEIYNIQGTVVRSLIENACTANISMNGLPEGLYIIKIRNFTGTYTGKIMYHK